MSKFEEVAKELEDSAKQLDKFLENKKDDLDDKGKFEANKIVDDTKKFIDETIVKVKGAFADVKEDERIKVLLGTIKDKAMGVVDNAKKAINSLDKQKEKCDCGHDCKCEEDCKCGDKCECSPECDCNCHDEKCECENYNCEEKKAPVAQDLLATVKKEALALGDKVKAYMEKPETKKAINDAKIGTIKLAEKALAGLKKLLKYEEPKE